MSLGLRHAVGWGRDPLAKDREPVAPLPVGRLASAIEPIVSGATRATKGRDDLRCGVVGYVVVEGHRRNVAPGDNSAMPKQLLPRVGNADMI